ncbi:MAG TPA: MOSC domain-containing protein [Rhizomicrobium sp.]|nr:MOSC domain-containing protein [Rhizomicrobium sp.]
MQLRLLSVNVGRPKIIALVNGEPVRSGIAKPPVGRESVFVGTTNIEGDQQADLSVHGGVDKAVYAYPADHWPWWEREHRLPCAPGTFGENLTLQGADETEICIGDRFAWGEVLLEVSQPRGPCFKLGIHTGRPEIPQCMTQSGRAGWYLRVLQEGAAPIEANLTRILASGGPNVREAFLAVYDPKTPRETCRLVHDAPGLAESWKRPLAGRLHKPL